MLRFISGRLRAQDGRVLIMVSRCSPQLDPQVADRMTTTTPYGHLLCQWETAFEKGSALAS